MKRPQVTGFAIGLLLFALGLVLLFIWKIPSWGSWEIPLAVLVVILILGTSYRITQNWLAPALFGAAVFLAVAGYFLPELLMQRGSSLGAPLALILGLIVDGAVLILLVVGFVLDIRGLKRRFRE